MSLQDPTSKMSKSDANENNYIAMLDAPDIITKKIRKAVMDSTAGITYEPETRPGVANLLTIYAVLANETPAAVAERYADKGNAALKNDVAETVVESLRPFQQRYQELMANQDDLRRILADGAEQARRRAEPTLRAVYTAMGFLPKV